MPFLKTPIADLLVFEPKVWGDDRGYFYESYNENTFREAGISNNFVQDNQAKIHLWRFTWPALPG